MHYYSWFMCHGGESLLSSSGDTSHVSPCCSLWSHLTSSPFSRIKSSTFLNGRSCPMGRPVG